MNDIHQIEPIQNNYEKYLTYKIQLGRYKKAINNGFYFEALLIDYAMLEDRLLAFLYHIGAIDNRYISIKITGRTKKYLREIYGEGPINLSNISGKIKLIRAVLKWAEVDEEIAHSQKYQYTLKKQCREQLDIPEFFAKLDEIDNWKDYRNEVIHALMNKNSTSLYAQIKQKASEGMDLARYIDKQTAKIKKGNYIRRSAKLKVER